MGNQMGSQKRERPVPAPLKVAMRRTHKVQEQTRLPNVAPRRTCLLRLLKQNRIHDYLTLESEFIKRENAQKSLKTRRRMEKKLVNKLRGAPVALGRIQELFEGETHAVVSLEGSKREWYIPILSIVDKDRLCLNALVLVKVGGGFKTSPLAIVGVVDDEVDNAARSYKIEKVPKETFEDIGGYEKEIQELKEAVELPLTHPELFEEMGINSPKGIILYGEPGTGKTLMAKAVAASTQATFIRATGSDLVRKNSGEGARVVRELFKLARDNAPCIVFLDEIDAVGTKRHDTSSRGEQEVQRTLLELLNQLDGFESRGDVKIIMATNRIDSLDTALIRPGRIDRKIELPKADEKQRQRIFNIHTSRMTVGPDVTFDTTLAKERDLSGAEIKAICTEAGMLALRAHRKMVMKDDFEKAIQRQMATKKPEVPVEFFA